MSLSNEKRHKKLVEMTDEEINFSDVPELDDKVFEQAIVYKNDADQEQVTLRLSQRVLDFFRNEGEDLQSQIDAVLTSYVDGKMS